MTVHSCESHKAAIKWEKFREILRATEALQMTVSK